MTTKQIEAAAQKKLLPYRLAAEIRVLLDNEKAKSKLTAEEWAETEGEILDLVGGED